GWMAPNYSISTSCTTCNFCILNAANHIIRGEVEVMLCGGSNSVIIPLVEAWEVLWHAEQFQKGTRIQQSFTPLGYCTHL
ncbi:hypothetical protein MKX03_030307, partial [Papaver bracteatum]